MKLYLIIIAVIVIIILIALFILFRILLRKTIKLSLFNQHSSPVAIPFERSMNVGKFSNNNLLFKEGLNESQTVLVENKDKTSNILKDKNKSNKKSASTKENNKIPLINNALKKTALNIEGLDKTKTSNKPVEKKESFRGLDIDSFDSVYKLLGSSEISDIVHYFEKNNIELINWRDNPKKISSDYLEGFLKSKIINFFNNEYDDLKYKISKLRKNGKNMDDAEFMLLSVPLKIKLFSATFSKKDFDLVIKKIGLIKELLKNFVIS